MRMMMQAKLPVIEGNRGIQDGSLAAIFDQVLEKMKPECVYFTSLGGCRAMIAVFDLKSPSDIPSIAEPLFMGAQRLGRLPALHESRGPQTWPRQAQIRPPRPAAMS